MSTRQDRGQSPISNSQSPISNPRERVAASGSDPDLSFVRAVLRISAGIIVWALHFTAIYGFTALACARGWQAAAPPVIAGATAVALIATLAVIVAGWRRRHVFEWWLSATIAAFGLIAIVYEAIPVLVVPVCA